MTRRDRLGIGVIVAIAASVQALWSFFYDGGSVVGMLLAVVMMQGAQMILPAGE